MASGLRLLRQPIPLRQHIALHEPGHILGCIQIECRVITGHGDELRFSAQQMPRALIAVKRQQVAESGARKDGWNPQRVAIPGGGNDLLCTRCEGIEQAAQMLVCDEGLVAGHQQRAG